MIGKRGRERAVRKERTKENVESRERWHAKPYIRKLQKLDLRTGKEK